jgi:hypothetical protein
MMQAGQIVEKSIESIRIDIASDADANWPPRDTTFIENRIRVIRRISPASSPKTGLNLPNVCRVNLVLSWGKGSQDSLEIMTFVSKKF